MNNPQLAIGCILSERWYAIRGFLAGLDGLVMDKSEVPLFLISNSDDRVFNDFVVGHLSKGGWHSVKLVKTGLPIISMGSSFHWPINDARFASAVHCFNIATRLFVECGASYGWFIEDDVSVPPDATRKHLAMFDHGSKVGATFAYAIQRWSAENGIGRYPLVWDYQIDLPATVGGGLTQRFKDLPDGQPLPELPYDVTCVQPSPSKWVEEVGSASTSSVMIRREVLQRLKWEVSYRGVKYYDSNLGLKLKELGYKAIIDWSLKVKHLHNNGEVVY